MVPLLLFAIATVLIAGTCIVGLRRAHRRLKPRRIVLIIALALAFNWLVWIVLDRASQPPDNVDSAPLTDAP